MLVPHQRLRPSFLMSHQMASSRHRSSSPRTSRITSSPHTRPRHQAKHHCLWLANR